MTRRTDPREIRLPVPAGELPPFTPVPRQTQRHDGWTDERQREFIEALADTGSVAAACKAVNMSTVGAYQLRRQPGADSFRKAWEAALALGVQRIEDVAMERALNGVELPVYSYGKLVGTRTSYNDRLLMFMLRNRAPQRFADGGRAKGLSGLDHTTLEQHKRKWRKEWELEQQAKHTQVSTAEVRASIDRKVEEIRLRVQRERQREWDALSDETRAAWERFQELKERDQSEQRLLTGDDRSATSGPQGRPPVAPYGAEPSEPNGSRPALEGENKSKPGIRRLKDESWK
jgi:hypothetical protein